MSDLLHNLDYPTNLSLLMEKRRTLRKQLLSQETKRIKKKIAVLGGSTTYDIVKMLDVFLLYNGIEAEFYECEYNRYYEDVMFNNEELKKFAPDIIWFHTSYRNLKDVPEISDTIEDIAQKSVSEYNRYVQMWQKCFKDYNCLIIQNNFEPPFYRLMGNKEVSDKHGLINFINSLNEKFYQFAQNNQNLFINDLNYVASYYGLDKWHDLSAWYLYKYCCSLEAIPLLAHNVSRIIKSIYGKNKKGFVLDLDNTLWGGIVGDDGADNLEIGSETATAQAYLEFQNYLKKHTQLGIILNIDSKNDEANALAGLNHPEGILKPSDFISIKANWDTKSLNLSRIAEELSLLPESLVFVDDNPAEREIVKTQIQNACVVDVSQVENYIKEINRVGFFEVTSLSKDDIERTQMYKANAERKKLQEAFGNYDDYLRSLDMHAEIKPFIPTYMQRIAQLTNKTNQFNLTTKRYTQSEIETVANDGKHICLYGKLVDKFGDNGVVSVIIGNIKEKDLHIELFLMSCRVLKRGMEFAMLDTLVKYALEQGITKIFGYYYKTRKNSMVSELYKDLGFTLQQTQKEDSVWSLDISDYKNRQSVISVEN